MELKVFTNSGYFFLSICCICLPKIHSLELAEFRKLLENLVIYLLTISLRGATVKYAVSYTHLTLPTTPYV